MGVDFAWNAVSGPARVCNAAVVIVLDVKIELGRENFVF